MRTSEQLDKIAAALLAFQKEIEPPKKNATADTGKFKYDYADLCSLLAHCKAGMQKNGLVFTSVGLTCRLVHTSGQWIEGDFPVEVHGLSAQQIGSALTYGRRYGFQGLLGINAEDDDDGAAATKPQGQTEKAVPAKPLTITKLPPGQSKLHPEPDPDRVPASVTDSQAPAEPGEDRAEESGTMTAEVVTLKALTKEKTDKNGTLHRSLLLSFADGSEDWWYCSHKASMDLAAKNKDKQIRARIEDKGGFKVCHEIMAVSA